MKLRKYQKRNIRNNKKSKLINGNKFMHEGSNQLIDSLIDNTQKEQRQQFLHLNRKGHFLKHDKQNQELRIRSIKFDWKIELQNKAQELKNLKSITLMSCQVSSENLKILSKMELDHLQKLSIFQDKGYYVPMFQPFNAYGIAQLLQNKWPCLQDLYLADNQIGNQGMDLILSSELYNLKKLDVGCNNIIYLGLINIPQTKLNNLTQLYLHFNPIRSQGVKLLVKANLELLEDIALSLCQIGDQGAKFLTKGKWPKLNSLSINDNNIQLTGYEQLSNNNWSSQLVFHQISYGCGCCSKFSNSSGIGIKNNTIQMFTFFAWNQKYLPRQLNE